MNRAELIQRLWEANEHLTRRDAEVVVSEIQVAEPRQDGEQACRRAGGPLAGGPGTTEEPVRGLSAT